MNSTEAVEACASRARCKSLIVVPDRRNETGDIRIELERGPANYRASVAASISGGLEERRPMYPVGRYRG